MAKLHRFNSHQISESTDEDNIKRAEFYGDEGLYFLSWYIDSDIFSIFFPDGRIKYFQLDILKPENHDTNPFRNIENGKLLSWIKHMLYSEDSKRTVIADEYKFESDIFNKQTIRVDNTHRAEFEGKEGLYKLAYFVDDDMFSIVFPDGKIKYYRTEALSPEHDKDNTLAIPEEGKLLSWIRHMLYSDVYNRSAIGYAQQMESENAVQSTFEFKDGGYTVTYIIDEDGTIWLTLPERVIVGTPDDICQPSELGGLDSIFGGKLFSNIKRDYESVTGKKF
ncbi:MAG: hypothetical protein J0L87_01545 [Bacteroidetes bacterium]|nr:hypothetical protein [Bacteroidota bacterium]